MLFKSIEKVFQVCKMLGRIYLLSREEDTVTVSEPSRKEPRVRTSVTDGRKFVKSDELIKSKKVRKQIKQLQKMIQSRP